MLRQSKAIFLPCKLLGPLSGFYAHGFTKITAVVKSQNPFFKSFDIANGNHVALFAVPNNRARMISGNHGKARGERLIGHERRSFMKRWKSENISLMVVL